MGKLKEKLLCEVPLSFETGRREEIHFLALRVQDGNHSLKTMLSLLETILSDIASEDQEIATLALRSLAYVLHIDKLGAEIPDKIASSILSALCDLVIATDKKGPCSLAIWCLSNQRLRPQLVETHLVQILEALMQAIEHPKSTKSMAHEALQALVKVAQRFSSVRTRSSIWAPAVYRRLLSGDKRDREIAEQCMKDLKLALLPPQLSLSKVVAVDISEMLLPKLEKMVKSKALVLSTVHAWGWLVRLLGGLAGENRTLVNQLLKIVEITFTSLDSSVRNASLVAWEALIDVLLQPSIISAPEDCHIKTGTNISTLSLAEPHLAPPLKRLKLLMVPLISIAINDKDESVRLACWRTWSYLAQKLGIGINQVSVVNIVVTPIFEAVFKYGPDKGCPSAWDNCLDALEAWICCKVQKSQALCVDIPGKAPSPETPTCQAPENVAVANSTILWAPWTHDLLEVLLKLFKVLWDMGVKSSQNSCISHLSLNAVLRMFPMLVKGVESDGKGSIKPTKEHVDAVHLLLKFLSNVSYEAALLTCFKDPLSAVWSLIASLMDLQPLVLSSSFYKLAFAPQEKIGQCFSTNCKVDKGREQKEILELRMVTPIVYIIAEWLWFGINVDHAGPDGESFKQKVTSLVGFATSGFNILGNLHGIASVLDWFLFEFCHKNTSREDKLLVTQDVKKETKLLQSCTRLLHSWRVFAEHTRSYLKRANHIPSVEGGMGDSGYEVIFNFLVFPLQICLHLASSYSSHSDSANLQKNSDEFVSAISGDDFQLVFSTWVELCDCASCIASRSSSQPNFFSSGLSQKILKLLENYWQQDSNKQRETANGGSFLAEMLAVVVANVLKQTEVSSLAMLAINRKKRLGSFMGMSGMINGARGSEADNTSAVRDVILLTSRVLDLSCDKFMAGHAYWLDSTARVLEELSRFTARLDLQHDVLMLLQDFSKPYAKWLKSTASDCTSGSLPTALIKALQKAWQNHLLSLQKCHPPLAFDSNLLSLQALALVPAFEHSETTISDCTVSFWEATYGSRASALKYPPCLVPVLSQLKRKIEISLPGWNRGCAESSRRKSDVSAYIYTGRRRLQMFQEHLVDPKKGVDTKKGTQCTGIFGPSTVAHNADINSQAGCPPLPGSSGNEELTSIDMPASVIAETSERPTGFVTSALTSMEGVQAGFDSSQAHLSPGSDRQSKNGDIMQGPDKGSIAMSTENTTVAPTCTKNLLLTNFIEMTYQGSMTISPPKCVLAPPKRKTLRFSDPKTFAYASSPASEEGRFPSAGHLAIGPKKHGDGSGNCNSSLVEAAETKTSLDVFNHSIGEKEEEAISTGDRILKECRLRRTSEIKKLGIRKQRFLRSTGSLRGGKFWRDASATVKALQKIKKQAKERLRNSTEVRIFPIEKVRKVGRPSLSGLRDDEALAEESRKLAVEKASNEPVRRKRGRPRRLRLINNDGALETTLSTEQVYTSADAHDMGRQVQTPCEQGANAVPSKIEKLLKKVNMESPFRVQTLNCGLYSKIFSSIANHSTAINSIASRRSHHRKNDFPKRIPLSKDEQEDDKDLQESCVHSYRKADVGKMAKEAERYQGFEFATPSKILRSGKRLKSRKWEAVETQKAQLDSISVANFYEKYGNLSHSLATVSHSVNAGVGVRNEFSQFSFGGSGNLPRFDSLYTGNQPCQHECKLGECSAFKQPPNLAFSEDSAGKAWPQNTNSSVVTLVSLENTGSLATTTSCDELGFNRESSDANTKKRRLCDVLADMSTSSEWNTMGLDDLNCMQKALSVLQDLVCESKKRALCSHARNL